MKFREKNNRFNSARMRNTAIYMYICIRVHVRFYPALDSRKITFFSPEISTVRIFGPLVAVITTSLPPRGAGASKVARRRRRDALTKDALFYRFAAPVRRKLYTVTNPARNYHVTSLAYCASGNAKD